MSVALCSDIIIFIFKDIWLLKAEILKEEEAENEELQQDDSWDRKEFIASEIPMIPSNNHDGSSGGFLSKWQSDQKQDCNIFCNICNKDFTTCDELIFHRDECKMRCKLCRCHFSSQRELEIHVNTCTVACNLCNSKFKCHDSLVQHILRCSLFCTVCGNKFLTRASLNAHQETCSLSCNICSSSIFNQS
jgi:hypothetical protein